MKVGVDGCWVQPGSLHPYQDQIFRSRSRLDVYQKGRRVGATWAAIGASCLRASRRGGQSTYYFSHTERGGLLAMSDVVWWCDRFDKASILRTGKSIYLGGSKRNAVSKSAVRFASGAVFMVMPGRGRNIRGIPGRHHYLVDEMALHVEPSEVVAAAGPTLATMGARITIISTVMFEDVFWDFCNSVMREIEDARAQGVRTVKSFTRLPFSHALEDGYYEREAWVHAHHIAASGEVPEDLSPVDCPRLAHHLEGLIGKAKLDGRTLYKPGARAAYKTFVYAHSTEPSREFECIPSRAGTLYMTRELIESALADDCHVFRWEAPRDFLTWTPDMKRSTVVLFLAGPLRVIRALSRNPKRSWYYGVDFGRSRDLTVIVMGYIDRGGVFRAAFVLELDNCPFDEQNLFFDQVVDSADHIAGGALDKGGNGARLAEHALLKLGESKAEGVLASSEWYSEHNSRLKEGFEDGMIAMPTDPWLVSDVSQLQLVKGVPRVPRSDRRKMRGAMGGTTAKFRHGDFAIALALAVYAAKPAFKKKTNVGGGFHHHRVGKSQKRRAMI